MQGRKFRLQTEGSSGGLGPQVPSLVDGKSVAAENFSTGMLHLPGRKNFESQGCGREDDRQPRLCQRKSHFSHQRSEISCQQIARPGLGNRTRASIAICHCERQISSVALREKPDLGQDKLSWLQRHDQDCGALYGVLPLCVGMPITATDHLDRGRGILRGCAGVVVGWVWPSETGERTRKENNCVWNQLPACILVRFKTKESWRIDGLPEDNVFPVAPQKKPWYLDKGKRRPMLRVTRKQFPLAPGFATTAHAAQGQTCSEGVLIYGHAHRGSRGSARGVHCVDACKRPTRSLCVSPFCRCSVSKRRKDRAGTSPATLGGWADGLVISTCKVSGRKAMLGMQRTEARWRIYAWALETIRWSPGMQRVYAKTCWRVGAVAMHGLQRLERRKRVRGDARPAAMYVLPCVSHVRGDEMVRWVLRAENRRQIFPSNVAEKARGRAVLYMLREEIPWLVDMRRLRYQKTKDRVSDLPWPATCPERKTTLCWLSEAIAGSRNCGQGRGVAGAEAGEISKKRSGWKKGTHPRRRLGRDPQKARHGHGGSDGRPEC